MLNNGSVAAPAATKADDLDYDEVPIFHHYSPEANVKCRGKGLVHTRSNPFAMLVIFRQTYECVRVLATGKIDISSKRWEVRQEAAAAQARFHYLPPRRDVPRARPDPKSK